MNDHLQSPRKKRPLLPLFLKLTLAFAVVTILSMGLSALSIRLRAQSEFDQYVRVRTDSDIGPHLVDFYTAHQGWAGVATVFTTPLPPPASRPRWLYTLVDANNTVVYGTGQYATGSLLPTAALSQGSPLEAGGKTVGYLIVDPAQLSLSGPTPESEFTNRLTNQIIISVLFALGLAVVIGLFSARALSRPIQDLTAATRLVAQGKLGYQVTVRSRDELGELGEAFNQMSADLAQANNLRTQMTADIAHELRSPLSVILGYAEALHEGKLLGSPEVFESLHVEARHLQRLIEDLRTLSLADAGELPLTPERVAPRMLLERARVAFAAQAAQRRIQLQADASAQLPLIEVDPDRMAQVLGNLVNNAMRYTPLGGEIQLSAAQSEGQIELRVKDNGQGITAEDLPHIFDRFYRSDESRHAESEESGLGLAIAKSIVEAHHGTISVESSPGKGATFILRLPPQAEGGA